MHSLWFSGFESLVEARVRCCVLRLLLLLVGQGVAERLVCVSIKGTLSVSNCWASLVDILDHAAELLVCILFLLLLFNISDFLQEFKLVLHRLVHLLSLVAVHAEGDVLPAALVHRDVFVEPLGIHFLSSGFHWIVIGI